MRLGVPTPSSYAPLGLLMSAVIAVTDLFEGTPYRLVRALAAGGMAEVYLVAHRGMGRQLVAKVPRAELADNPQIVDRMRIEAQAIGRLKHPNIVSVAGFGTLADGRPYIVTEYLRGRTLTAELAERGRLPLAEALQYSRELLSALIAAHALGIVHRDIKPDNIFVCVNPGGSRFIKVLDFGIARVLPDAPELAPAPLSDATATGVLVGTPRFLSPEGALGGRVDHRGDIYSAALVIYLLVVGRGPFDHIRGDDMLLTAHAIEDPERVSKLSESPLPTELDALIVKALRKDPAERFQTAEELLQRVECVRTVLLRSPRLLETSVYRPFSPAGAQHAQNTSVASTASAPSRDGAVRGGASQRRVLSLPGAMLAFVLSAAFAALLGGAIVAILARTLP